MKVDKGHVKYHAAVTIQLNALDTVLLFVIGTAINKYRVKRAPNHCYAE